MSWTRKVGLALVERSSVVDAGYTVQEALVRHCGCGAITGRRLDTWEALLITCGCDDHDEAVARATFVMGHMETDRRPALEVFAELLEREFAEEIAA